MVDFKILNLNYLESIQPMNFPDFKLNSFILITNGWALLQIDFDEHIAIKNKIFFIDRFKQWNWIKTENLSGYLVQFTDTYYNIIYTGNPKIKSDQSLYGEIPPFIKTRAEETNSWIKILDLIDNEYSNLTENSKEIICLNLKILVLMYRRKAIMKNNIFIHDRKNQKMHEFRKLVNSRYGFLRSTKDYAFELNLSPNYLNALCKEVYLKTASEIISERVILESKRLLSRTGLTVSEISDKLGFKDNSYFGRYFKKAVGMPPEKYRLVNLNH